MPSTSRSQQRLFGLVHAVQQGEAKAPSAKIKSMAKRVDPTAVGHFAATKHKKLPEHRNPKTALDSGTSPSFGTPAGGPASGGTSAGNPSVNVNTTMPMMGMGHRGFGRGLKLPPGKPNPAGHPTMPQVRPADANTVFGLAQQAQAANRQAGLPAGPSFGPKVAFVDSAMSAYADYRNKLSAFGPNLADAPQQGQAAAQGQPIPPALPPPQYPAQSFQPQQQPPQAPQQQPPPPQPAQPEAAAVISGLLDDRNAPADPTDMGYQKIVSGMDDWGGMFGTAVKAAGAMGTLWNNAKADFGKGVAATKAVGGAVGGFAQQHPVAAGLTIGPAAGVAGAMNPPGPPAPVPPPAAAATPGPTTLGPPPPAGYGTGTAGDYAAKAGSVLIGGNKVDAADLFGPHRLFGPKAAAAYHNPGGLRVSSAGEGDTPYQTRAEDYARGTDAWHSSTKYLNKGTGSAFGTDPFANRPTPGLGEMFGMDRNKAEKSSALVDVARRLGLYSGGGQQPSQPQPAPRPAAPAPAAAAPGQKPAGPPALQKAAAAVRRARRFSRSARVADPVRPTRALADSERGLRDDEMNEDYAAIGPPAGSTGGR